MNIWRLEWLRLVRTHRLLAILGVYVFFGLTGPLTVRYLSHILERLGTAGIEVRFPAPVPADGIAQFTGDAAQIGLMVVVLVAGAALSFDNRREMAIFLRTRVNGVREVILPAYATNAAAAVCGLLAGSLAAWYETAILIGPLPVARMILGIGLGALFLCFAVALVALMASVVKGALATSGISLAVLLALAIAGNLGGGQLTRWLPTTLAGAMAGLAGAARPVDYLPAALVTVLASAASIWAAIVLASRREL